MSGLAKVCVDRLAVNLIACLTAALPLRFLLDAPVWAAVLGAWVTVANMDIYTTRRKLDHDGDRA